MADVSKRLITQFAGNLEQVIAARTPAPAEETAPAAPAESTGGAAPAPAAPTAPAPQLNNEALDLGNAALVPVLKRVVPAVIVVGVAIGVIWWLASRN